MLYNNPTKHVAEKNHKLTYKSVISLTIGKIFTALNNDTDIINKQIIEPTDLI